MRTAAVAVGLLLLAAPAASLPVIGGSASLDVTLDRDAAGVGVGVLPGGSFGAPLRIVLPVTGGDVEGPPLVGQLELGSGIGLFDSAGASIVLTDLLVDLTREVLAATLLFDDGAGMVQSFPGLDLLFLRDCALSAGVDPCRDAEGALVGAGFGLDLTGTLALFLNDAFFPLPEDPFFVEGDAFALASAELVFVPEPATALLVGLGAAALGLLARRRASGARAARCTDLRAWLLTLPFAALLMAPTCGPPSEVVEIPGLLGEVRLVTDRLGTPHIFATRDEDALRVQGWVHARDRLWQMDLNRRQADGTSMELLGGSALADDVQFRVFGLKGAGERIIEVLSPRERELGEAFVAGVNAWIEHAEATGQLPPEYAELELTKVRRWTLADTGSLGKGFIASQNLSIDLGRLEYCRAFVTAGEAASPAFDGETLYFEDVLRPAPLDPSSTVPDATGSVPFTPDPGLDLQRCAADSPMSGRALERMEGSPLLARLMRRADIGIGSNWWGVSAERSENGNPMIANDPHLVLSTPPILYFNHLVVTGDPLLGDLNVSGFSLAGVPGVAIGQNESIAWGATTNPVDQTDVFSDMLVKGVEGCEGICLESEGALHPVEIAVPEFFVNQPDNGVPDDLEPYTGPLPPVGQFVITVPFRGNGPVVELERPAIITGAARRSGALTLQWTGLYPTFEIRALLEVARARNFEEFRAAFRNFDGIASNLIYADKDGNLAYYATSEVPLRRDLEAGGDPRCLPPWFVRDGSGPCNWIPDEAHSQGQALPLAVIPEDEMPFVWNPPRGFLVNANNDPAGVSLDNDVLNQRRLGNPEGVYYLGFDFTSGFRSGRIEEVLRDALSAGGQIGVDDMKRLQGDTVLLDAERLRPFLLAAFENASRPGAPPALAELADDPRIAEAVTRLAAWDFSTPTGIPEGYDAHDTNGQRTSYVGAREAANSVAATIWAQWRAYLLEAVVEDTLSRLGIPRLNFSEQAVSIVHRLLSEDPFTGLGVSGVDFFPEPAALSAADRRDVTLLGVLRRALERLGSSAYADAFGGSQDMDDWRWGRLHRITFLHELGDPFSIPTAGGFDDLSPALPGIPRDGGWRTVNVANHNGYADTQNGFGFSGGASRRYVGVAGGGAAPGPRVVGFDSLPGGPSGVLGSPFFASRLAAWLSVDYAPVAMTEADASRAAAKVEILRAPSP
jgi:penicillin amidase